MKKLLYLPLLIALVAVGSCKKELPDNAKPAPTPTNFKELKATNTFNWQTFKAVTLDVKGTKTTKPVKANLKVTSTDGKHLYFNTVTFMDKNVNVKFNLPKTVKEVNVSFGKVTKKVQVSNDKISFDCKPNLPPVQ